ncbi:MAG: hypothetical protein K6G36_00775 [Candidatus Saccharibacteria bacterium]|nr:hypothetical protein [Candidatus Saccharibacteria bacterium]
MNDSDINQQQLEEQLQTALAGMNPDEVKDVFVQSLILEKYSDRDDIDDELFEEIKRDLSNRLDIKINDKLVGALPAEKVDELDKVIEDGANSDAIRGLLADNGVDLDKLVADAMKDLHDEFINDAANNEGE